MYPWPASAISEQEMALLYQAREASKPRVPITELIRRAVVETYGQQREHDAVLDPIPAQPLREAA